MRRAGTDLREVPGKVLGGIQFEAGDSSDCLVGG
eukprot:CAMPEP_0115714024 /NCGR_PEP_ID=MMETSP0272-20121206/74998_1 /TAXON_ID=71861 /ORGANISM="Scrippsiella trochoidea, Strain CCMP3099" /LENGTH=33 /DNA_ID= /DNA_START= /DNA_END= /DNA_ORIENTATION=